MFAIVESRQLSTSSMLREGTTIPDDPPSMNQAGNPAQDGQADVDEQIGAAPALEEDRQLDKMLATQVLRAKRCKVGD